MLSLLRRFILVCLARPFAKFVLGMDTYGKLELPDEGPAIIAANHNSHIDTLILLCLFPSRKLSRIRPVAAADHFLINPLASWFYRNIVGILPVDRSGESSRDAVLAGCKKALAQDEILIIFPEGSRGEAEEMSRFKSGVATLSEAFPDAPVFPVYIQGAGKALPKDSKLLVPFNCAAVVGRSFTWTGEKDTFMAALRGSIEGLSRVAPPLRWA